MPERLGLTEEQNAILDAAWQRTLNARVAAGFSPASAFDAAAETMSQMATERDDYEETNHGTQPDDNETTVLPQSDAIRVFNTQRQPTDLGDTVVPPRRPFGGQGCEDSSCGICHTSHGRAASVEVDFSVGAQPDDRRTAWAKRLP